MQLVDLLGEMLFESKLISMHSLIFQNVSVVQISRGYLYNSDMYVCCYYASIHASCTTAKLEEKHM